MTELYFHTSNTALALALETAGVKRVAVHNIYKLDQLRKMGTTAKAAHAAGKPGVITYYFERCDGLTELLAAWDDEAKKVDAGEESEIPNCTPDELMRVACRVLKLRNTFANYWRQTTPFVMVPNEGEPKRRADGDGYRMDYPGFRLVSVDAPDAVKQKLGFAV